MSDTKSKDTGPLQQAAETMDHLTRKQPSADRPHWTIERYRDALEHDGFASETGENIRSLLGVNAISWVNMARDAGRGAPLDQSRGGYDAGRHRYYSAGLYLKHAAAGRRFVPCPPFVDVSGEQFMPFLQPPGMNRDYDTERRFAPIPDILIKHDGVQEIVDLCFQITPSSMFPNEGCDWLRVGLHIISLHARGARPGVSSPNRAHVDGELVTSIVMLERVNVVGGISLVVDRDFADMHPNDIPNEFRRARVTLEDTLDVLSVDDRRVAHYVFPVFARRNTEGHRTVLLIDFTPLLPQTSDQLLKLE